MERISLLSLYNLWSILPMTGRISQGVFIFRPFHKQIQQQENPINFASAIYLFLFISVLY